MKNLHFFLTFFLAIFSASLVFSQEVAPFDAKYLEKRHPRRLALVVGNFDYEHHSELPGVESDIEGVVAAFTDIGFDLIQAHANVPDWEAFNFDVFKPFRNEIQRDDLVVIYLSGHGFAYQGYQYFAPSKMPKQLEFGKVATTAIPIEALITALGKEGPAAVLVIVDACRTIPTNLVLNDAGEVVEKGQYQRRTEVNSTEYILALSVESGLPSLASTDPTTKSVYTSALLNYFQPDQDFRLLHDHVEFDVEEATDSKQKPGLHEYSKTSIYLSNTEDWALSEKELWESVLAEADERKVRKYLGMRRLSPYARSARLWLKEEGGNELVSSSPVSPIAIEAAWQMQDASLGSLTSSVRFRSAVEYSQVLDNVSSSADPLTEVGLTRSPRFPEQITPTQNALVAYSQWITENTGAFVPSGTRLRTSLEVESPPQLIVETEGIPTRLARVDQQPLVERTVTENITEEECVPRLFGGIFGFDCRLVVRPVSRQVLVPDPEWRPRTWVAVPTDGDREGFITFDTSSTGFQTEIGKPSHEAIISVREPEHLGLVDSDAVEEAIAMALQDNSSISWASISMPVSVDELSRAENEFRISNLSYQLVKAGVPRDRITAVYENPNLLGDTIRLRLFAN